MRAAFIAIIASFLSQLAPGQSEGKSYPKALSGGRYMVNFYLPPAPSSHPWWPEWSPDGKALAFAMHGSIWKLDLSSTIAEELTHDSSYHSSPAWSPDGRWMAYTADAGGKSINLMLLDLKTGTSVPLTQGDFVNVDPAWSPDGRRLVYVSTRPNGYFNIIVMEVVNGSPGASFAVTSDNRFGRNRLYMGDQDVHISPAWSTDGRELILVCNRGIALGTGAIWKMPAVPNGFSDAKMIHREETLYRTRPHWSPDGTRIVYSSHRNGASNQLYLIPATGGEPLRFTLTAYDYYHPKWSPDGRSIAFVSNERGLPELGVLPVFGGGERRVEIRSLKWRRPMGIVKFRVEDSQSKRLLAARVYSVGADGKAYAPRDSFQLIGRLGEHMFHTSGEAEMEAPPGQLRLKAMHGFEYVPASILVNVEPGKTVTAKLSLPRLADLAREGWYSGSNHVHMRYAGNLRNTPDRLLGMAAAEDLAVVTAHVSNKDNRVIDHEYFTGVTHPLSGKDRVLRFNQEYRPSFYGHVSLINLTKHLFMPNANGYEGSAIESPYPSNTDILRLSKAQGGLNAYVHPFNGSNDPLGAGLGGAKAFPVDVALGTVDYHEVVSSANQAGLKVWHHILNNGFRVPAVGGEDSITDHHHVSLIGQNRAFAYFGRGAPPTWEGWLDAIRKGRLFVTNGPLVKLEVEGQMAGSEVQLDTPRSLRVTGSIKSIVPLSTVEIVFKGSVIETIPAGDGRSIDFARDIPVRESGWLTLQVSSPGPAHPIDDNFPQATTNPIWITVGGRPVRSEESARYFVRWIDKLISMANAMTAWRTSAEREHVIGQFVEARQVYERLASEAK